MIRPKPVIVNSAEDLHKMWLDGEINDHYYCQLMALLFSVKPRSMTFTPHELIDFVQMTMSVPRYMVYSGHK